MTTTFPLPSDIDVAALRAGLAGLAEAEGLLDVSYRTVDSPFGALLIAATEVGVVRVAFEREDHSAVLAQLSTVVSPRLLSSTRRTEVVTRQLGEYFEHRRQQFDVPLDLGRVPSFRRSVLTHLADIGYGSTASYATVAAAAGNPRAVRAVGTACSHNPVPLLLPCHRVVRSDGSIGQYLGGADTKAALLAMEAT